jgi:hypothetical protein
VTSARPQHLLRLLLRGRSARLVLPAVAATLVTGTVVGVAVADNDAEKPVPAAAPVKPMTVQIDPADSPYLAARVGTFSRSAKRVTLKEKPEVVDREWLTAPLNLWPEPREHGKPLAVLAEGGQVAVTGAHRNGFAQILHRGLVRWVNADYLAEEKPKPPEPVVTPEPETSSPEPDPTPDASTEASPEPEPEPEADQGGPVSDGGACASGSSMESGIVSQAVSLHRAVCAQFPQVTEYGGYRGDGEHSDGHAIDIMVYGDFNTGQAVADWLRAHAGELGLDDIIWAQHIWTNQRSSEGWRSMPDRGSATANHYDHVHVRVF